MLIFIGIHININDIHFTTRSIPYVFLKSKLLICIVQVICSTMHYWLTRGSIVYRVIISLWSAYRLLQMPSLTSQRKNPIVALSCMWRNYKRPINNCLREIGKSTDQRNLVFGDTANDRDTGWTKISVSIHFVVVTTM